MDWCKALDAGGQDRRAEDRVPVQPLRALDGRALSSFQLNLSTLESELEGTLSLFKLNLSTLESELEGTLE